jgi:hypothetical protein
MCGEWKHTNTVTGDAATNERYLRRNNINEDFWREVRKGNHILFVAPRRVGKTSIMKDLALHCPEGFAAIYENIEGVTTREEFYQRLFELIIHSMDRSRLKQAREFIGKCMKKYKITEISKSGIKFESLKIDYEREIRDLVPELKKAKVHAVIFLDEFAEVIHKLKKSGKPEDAVSILHTLREMRSNDGFEHFTIAYAGSVGLEFVIKSIDRPKLINDLHTIPLKPLTDEEVSQLIRQLTADATICLQEDVLNYLKRKIGYLLPYYLQLMIAGIDKVACGLRMPDVNREIIDAAFQNILKEKKNFEDWLLRLKEYYAGFFPFINDILKHTAHRGFINVQEIYSKAERFNRTEDYMDFVDDLVHDGYLSETEKHIYRFTSPLLEQFWVQKFPIYA